MANTKKDDLISWLRDAHAMEAAHVDNLERLIGLSDEYPQLKTQLQSHLEVSKRQRDDIQTRAGAPRFRYINSERLGDERLRARRSPS